MPFALTSLADSCFGHSGELDQLLDSITYDTLALTFSSHSSIPV